MIKHWIETGADFNKQTVSYEKNDTLSNSLVDYLILPKKKVDEANNKDINELIQNGFVIRKLVFGEPYISATYSNNDQKISKKAMKSLISVSDQLVELNLQESKLTDNLASGLKKLKSLRILRLDQTKITDKSLNYLRGMEKLDEILRAEEAARHAVSDARERVRDIRKKALSEAELIKSSAVRETAEKAADLQKEILHEADSQAVGIEHDAETALGKMVYSAKERCDSAVALVVDELVG